MDAGFVLEQIKELCKSKEWRNLMAMLDDGYRGMFVILRILQDGPVSAGEIATEMNVSTARVASALKSLEGKGYITREKNHSDGRKVIVSITQKGNDAFDERKGRVVGVIQPMIDKLSEHEAVTMLALLQKFLG